MAVMSGANARGSRSFGDALCIGRDLQILALTSRWNIHNILAMCCVRDIEPAALVAAQMPNFCSMHNLDNPRAPSFLEIGIVCHRLFNW